MLSLLVFSCSLIYPWFSFLPLSSSPLSHSEIRNRTQNVGWQKHGALFFFSIGTAPLWRTNYPTKCFFFFKTKIVVLQQHLLPSRRDGCFCCREAAIFLFLTISKLLQTREVSPVQFLSLPPPPHIHIHIHIDSNFFFATVSSQQKLYVFDFRWLYQTLLSAFFKKLIFICPLFQLIVISKFIAILLVKSV